MFNQVFGFEILINWDFKCFFEGVCSLLLDLESRHFHGQQENRKTTALVYLHHLHPQMFKTGCCKLMQSMNPNHPKLKSESIT
jgi:hypothetical protein